MKRSLALVAIAAGVLAGVAPAANAHPNYHYEGGCSFSTVSDGTDSEQTVWTGQMNVAVVATTASADPTVPGVPAAVPISVECVVLINGETPGTVELTANGIGAAANGREYTFTADPDDIVTVCDVVDVNGDIHTNCGDATTTPIVPQPVQDVLMMVYEQIDPTICDAITTAATTANFWGVPGVVDIMPDGDIWVGGQFFWDCPPYES